MLTLPSVVKVMVCARPVSMRNSFDGLAALVRDELHGNPLSGHLFIFFNKSGDQVRILYWERSGYCVVAKRLERGRFKLPWADDRHPKKVYELEAAELLLLLEGIELKGAKRRPRWTVLSGADGDGCGATSAITQ